MKEIFEGLKEIVFNSNEFFAKEKALDLLFIINNKMYGVIKVDNYLISAIAYNDTVQKIKNEQKIQAIKTLRDDLRNKKQYYSLRELKKLVERISIIEKIPMINGYEPD